MKIGMQLQYSGGFKESADQVAELAWRISKHLPLTVQGFGRTDSSVATLA